MTRSDRLRPIVTWIATIWFWLAFNFTENLQLMFVIFQAHAHHGLNGGRTRVYQVSRIIMRQVSVMLYKTFFSHQLEMNRFEIYMQVETCWTSVHLRQPHKAYSLANDGKVWLNLFQIRITSLFSLHRRAIYKISRKSTILTETTNAIAPLVFRLRSSQLRRKHESGNSYSNGM